MKRIFEHELIGTLQGFIWMPYAECTKEASLKFVRHGQPTFYSKCETLEEAIDRITNDGDFRSCELKNAVLKTTMHKGNRDTIKYTELLNTWL